MHSRGERLANPFVLYASPTPQALADTLADVVSTENFMDLATSASASVESISWEVAGSVVEKSILGSLRI